MHDLPFTTPAPATGVDAAAAAAAAAPSSAAGTPGAAPARSISAGVEGRRRGVICGPRGETVEGRGLRFRGAAASGVYSVGASCVWFSVSFCAVARIQSYQEFGALPRFQILRRLLLSQVYLTKFMLNMYCILVF